MVREDWVSVGIPRGVINELDLFLKTEDAKKIGVMNRQQIIALLLRKFLDNGIELLSDSKLGIEEIRKIQDDIDDKLKDIETIKNTVKDQNKEFLETVYGKDKIKQLDFIHNDGGNITIHDKEIKQDVIIANKDKMPFCNYHNANFCHHISFLTTKLLQAGFEHMINQQSETHNP